MTTKQNEAAIWRALSLELRKRRSYDSLAVMGQTPERRAELQALWKFGDCENWIGSEFSLPWGVGEILRMLESLGLGLQVGFLRGEDLETWGLQAPAETLESIIKPERLTKCEVCTHPRLTEIEILIISGGTTVKVSELLGISSKALRTHREVCMARRKQRLEEQLGFVLDVQAHMSAKGKADRVFKLAEKAAEAAVEKAEFAAVDRLVDRLHENAKITAVLDGENAQPVGTDGGMPVHAVIMPRAEPKKLPPSVEP